LGVIEPVDISTLPGPAQKILDPAGPAPLKQMAAKGVVPGLRPGEIVTVIALLAQGEGPTAATATETLGKLPKPLIAGALAGELHPWVLDRLTLTYANDFNFIGQFLQHRSLANETVAELAGVANEGVAELIATNEERLLANPKIIEKLYLNKSTRMSTADRIIELAVRNKIELTGIPAFREAAAAIAKELVAEATEERTFDDDQFDELHNIAATTQLAPDEDTHVVDEAGKEQVTQKAKALNGIWAEMRPPGKIRLLQLGVDSFKRDNPDFEGTLDAAAVRMLGVRDPNPLVAVAAVKSPSITESEIQRIAGMRNVSEDVLRIIAMNRDYTRSYAIKYALVANPRTPFAFASQWVTHLRESDLRNVAKSKDVAGAVANAARNQLQRKGKH
jgi:hypothetical protein